MSIPMAASSALNAQARESKAKPASSSRYLCFGGFQLDTQRELLFKDGAKLRLPGKVFQTLVALLEKPGEVVTREALRERLWPQGTFVNYDANVNTTLNKLRLVLGDSPDEPSYIETIPRLGYCFVGSVERQSELSKTPAVAVHRAFAGTVEPNASASTSQEIQLSAAAALPDRWLGLRTKGWAAVVLLCGVLIGMGIVLLTHRI
jgi:DNA-binding winged helix-turn-helix (wHTH) protein